jgi:hypothetical protein
VHCAPALFCIRLRPVLEVEHSHLLPIPMSYKLQQGSNRLNLQVYNALAVHAAALPSLCMQLHAAALPSLFMQPLSRAPAPRDTSS